MSCFLATMVAARAESGTLEIYPVETQIGTMARRVFTDEQRRPLREILYRAKASAKAPLDESHLVAYQTRLYRYDEHGRETWMGEYSPALILHRSLETLHNAAGQLQTRQWRDADGIVRYQIRYEGGRPVSHLHYDEAGQRLLKVQGKIPEGIDPASIQVIK